MGTTRRAAEVSAQEILERTERVHLRALLASDREEYTALRRKSRRFLAPWEQPGPPGEAPFGGRAFARQLDPGPQGRKQRLVVCRNEDGAILGGLALSEIARGILQSAQVGWWIGAPHARAGTMTEGLGLLLRHAFERLKLHRVEALIRPENEPSRRLARRCGFRFEGLARRLIRLRGQWRDHERWAITVEDWRIWSAVAQAAGSGGPVRPRGHRPQSRR